MKIFYTPLLILFVSILFVQCNKAKSNKWLFADIEVRDEVSNELIAAEIELHYRYKDKTYGAEEFEVELLGQTQDGRFHIEKEFDSEINYPQVAANGTDYYHLDPKRRQSSQFYSLSANGPNEEVVLEILPLYRMDISFKNTECFNETDSLFFTLVEYTIGEEDLFVYDTLVGCYEGVSELIPSSISGKELNFIAYIKRDGVRDQIETRYFLEPFIENDIVFEY